jgi:hypothetical protein
VIGKKLGHNEAATVADTKGGADFNKDSYLQWGIASEVESNNNLLNLLKLVVTTLDSSNPTLLPTNNDSGIANSGSLEFSLGPDAPVNNYDATLPTIEVQVANNTPVQSIASPELASVPNLPAFSRIDHVMSGFPNSLIGLTPFVDAGWQVIFTKMLVIVFDANDKAILIG